MSTEASTPEPSPQRGFRLSDTIALTALPIVAYLILFVYRVGYFGVFELPHQYIELSIGEVFSLSGGLVFALVTVFFVIDFLDFVFSGFNFPSALRRRYRIYAPVFAGAYLPLILGSYTYPPRTLVLLIVIPVLFAAVDFILPLFTHRATRGYLNRLAAGDEYQANLERNTLIRRLVAKIGPRTFQVFFWAAFGLYFCYHLGRSTALHQVDYRVANTTPELVVLITLKDKLVVAPFDRASHSVEPSYMVIDPSRENGPVLRLEAIGPLHLNKPTPTPTATPDPTSTPPPTVTPTVTLP